MNYGEDIGYWYLRLNGFFLLQNYVAHGMGNKHPLGQIDLLGVRPAHVFEDVGGQDDDWDPELFEPMHAEGQAIGLICEVKTGDYEGAELFRQPTLGPVIRRLGLIDDEVVDVLVDKLVHSPQASTGTVTIAKLLIAVDPTDSPLFLSLSLDDVEDFVQGRAARYVHIKQRDRMLFPQGLFQFAINRARRALEE